MKRIAVAPAFREHYPAEYAALEDEADRLGVYVSVHWANRRHHPEAWYRVTVWRGLERTQLVGQGRADAVVAGALDDFEQAFRWAQR